MSTDTEPGERSDEAPASRPRGRRLWRMVPFGLLLLGLVAFFLFGGHRLIGFEQVAEHSEALIAWVDRWGVWAALVFGISYAAMVAFSIPGAALATLLGGFLFGIPLGVVTTVLGATAGSVAVFLAARTACGDLLRAKAGSAVGRMEAGFRENALSYLLFLRLVPVFPFWLVNLVPAFLGVRLRIFVVATLFGIIPGSVVYVAVGSGLGELVAAGEAPDLAIIFRPSILLPILGLAFLALLPIAVKRFRQRGR